MGIMSGNPKEQPMHYGEVFSTWSYLAGIKAMVAAYQTQENHCGDEDLKKMIKALIEQGKQEEEEVVTLLKENGIALPPSPPERSKASLEDIPVGARINDAEIALSISKDIAAGLVACSQAMGQCTREDIAMMFGQFHTVKAQNGAKMLKMNKEKGWLVPPPLHAQKHLEAVPVTTKTVSKI
ncbi:DUF3231 family protein [Alteribacter keqinensis]|uniref:DUF3231 family protein n=1 Tax=Alteribacter keqinensis TaxID=2483800 RepID=A0A3M7TP49_9BACI|nr:DUF3231 family protein [Alteribacter keqinensis]RNA66906.1 DUF3231 family protein [Alteribacter keqinensis]